MLSHVRWCTNRNTYFHGPVGIIGLTGDILQVVTLELWITASADRVWAPVSAEVKDKYELHSGLEI